MEDKATLSPQPSGKPESPAAQSPEEAHGRSDGSGGRRSSAGITLGGGEASTKPETAPAAAEADASGAPSGQADWRAMLAGDDTKALERLSRYKSPTDVAKALVEAQTKLSQRQEPVKLTPESSPEEIAAWRKAWGIKDVAAGADAGSYVEAYGIKPPDGYDLSPIESAMLGDFAKAMYDQNAPPQYVTAATEQFFRAQHAMREQQDTIISERRREWQDKLRDELGSREYKARQTAAAEWLRQQFEGDEEGLTGILTAQLPGGGLLGDHPWLFNLAAQQAMGAGLTDRIEANSLESGGKSLAEQQHEIEQLMFTDRAAYNEAAKEGGRLEKIIGLRMSRGELDENGNEVRGRSRRAS